MPKEQQTMCTKLGKFLGSAKTALAGGPFSLQRTFLINFKIAKGLGAFEAFLSLSRVGATMT